MRGQRFPNFIEGHALVRDKEKRFVAQVAMTPTENVIRSFIEYKWDWEYEIQVMKNGTWIPMVDLVPTADAEELARTTMGKSSPDELLLIASKHGVYDVIKWALAFGANINTKDSEALFSTVQGGHELCVRVLVNRGAKLTERAIQAAVECGNAKIQEYMNPLSKPEIATGFAAARKLTQDRERSKDELAKSVQRQRIAESELERLNKEDRTENSVHTPKCPTCGSSNLSRIALSEKGALAVLFGLFSVGHAAKSFRCSNCGYTW